ncbi:DNA polymerase family B-domain-containing protein [Chytridium lagenaria]|nr:DNA polymerase family B-domain-containing protein [Chytridium lagenaria]
MLGTNDSSMTSKGKRNADTVPAMPLKRQKVPGKSEGLSFEERLQSMHEEDMDVSSDYFDLWPRKPCDINNMEDLVFQQLDIDETIGDSRQFYKTTFSQSAILRMYGTTNEGGSVVCHVHGFSPYFYVPAPPGFNENHLPAFRTALDTAIRTDSKRQENHGSAVVSIEFVMKQSIFGYQGPDTNLFLQIYVRFPDQVTVAKRLFEHGLNIPGFPNRSYTTFESNIPFTLRFMIDTKIVGANWLTLPKNKYTVRNASNKISNCQIEVDVYFEHIMSHDPEDEWSKVAPLRILSFDIECAGRKGVFPDAEEDPVIQIANMVTIQGQQKPFIRNVFTLKQCANIVGTHTLCFDMEGDLLRKWREFVETVDPDVIIGYNTTNFDFPYLLDRATKLGINDFPFLGRIKGWQTKAKDTRFSSKAFGTRDNKAINILIHLSIHSRLQVDLLQLMQRDYKLRSYSLNSVSAHFLGEQKEDDAYLPQRLLDKLMCMINYIEMARVTGVPFNMLLTRGQQIKVVSQLYRKARDEGLLIPSLNSEGSDEQYEGAIVIEPEKGFYEDPIATLDFTSLYPSIMMAHNLCYSTYLPDIATVRKLGLSEDEYDITPNNDIFVKPKLRKGLLPTVLEDLLAARKRAKADLKKATDPFVKAVLDGRQLALKISANSVYGFTGATVGKLPLLAISSSVTAYGREMIDKTKLLVEEKFCIKNGYQHDARVIYGDTDSVMVKFGPKDVGEAMALGREAAAYVTGHFIRPINLDFEKKYAGLYWSNPTKFDKLDAKGIETVRRDSCRMVSVVIDTCLKKLLIERDVKGAENYVKKVIAELLQNKIDLSQLVISKALGKTEYAGKQAHNELAERMRKRDSGSAPSTGDRVSYVIIKGTKDAAAYEKAEDPLYVLENNLPIDTKYYLENQLANPVMRIFEPILGEKASTLFSGDHVRKIQVAAPATGALMKFAVRTATCLGCKTPLPKNVESAVCKNCKPKTQERNFRKLWTQCQRCQGSLHQDIICSAQDCPIFYMRKRAQKDMNEASTLLSRFNYNW